MTWRDVFDGEKYSNQTAGSTTVYKVNEFVSRYTNYVYFSFNGTIFPVRAVRQFDSKYVEYHYTHGLKIDNLK